MNSIKFFVEGKDDSLFLTAFVKYLFNIDLGKESFVTINGATYELLNQQSDLFIKNSIKENNSGINLLVFDADRNNFTETQENLLKWKTELRIEFDLFLFPNNSGDGNFETLLEKIANSDKSEVFNCFDLYLKCIGDLNVNYSLPDSHAKLFAYEEAILSKAQFDIVKNKSEKYLLKELYDLNSAYLTPLKTFLSNYFVIRNS